MIQLQGQTALITGASNGIGEEFARQLAAKGCHLLLTARSKDKLDSLARELEGKHGIHAAVFQYDLSDPESPKRLFEEVSQRGLQVDLLINNAGFGRCGSFENDRGEDARMILLNVNALVTLTRLFIPAMLERKKGGVINVASTASFQPLPFMSIYAATKAFVVNFTEGLWGEYLGRGVRILCLCPGNTRTGFHDIAGIRGLRIFLPATAESLVRFGLEKFCRGNAPTVIHGWANFLLSAGYRLLPRRCMPLITRLIYKARST